MTSGSLWNYYRNEVIDDENENDNATINNNNKITSKSFEYTVFSLLNAVGIYIFFLILGWASIGERC